MLTKLPKLPDFYAENIIKIALEEDINYIDVTSDLLELPEKGSAVLVAKEDGILSGIDIAKRVFTFMDSQIDFHTLIGDGRRLEKGNVIAQIDGNTSAILKAERTALNILQHMSGIATYTGLCVAQTIGTNAVIADTRKTLPGLRPLQKYAVLCGGGSNHRFNLSSAAMLKDNHIDAYGSISEAVKALRERVGHTVSIEVEVRDLEQLQKAIEAGADIVMLDNMSLSLMREAVETVRRAAAPIKLEASGNITLENIREVAETGVDIISIGALTHSVKALDISLKWQ